MSHFAIFAKIFVGSHFGKGIDSAMALAEVRGLRGYDAVQLAAGCAVNAVT